MNSSGIVFRKLASYGGDICSKKGVFKRVYLFMFLDKIEF